LLTSQSTAGPSRVSPSRRRGVSKSTSPTTATRLLWQTSETRRQGRNFPCGVAQ
jgi:hypothetical protein